jgi:hypothetical protein
LVVEIYQNLMLTYALRHLDSSDLHLNPLQLRIILSLHAIPNGGKNAAYLNRIVLGWVFFIAMEQL